MVDKTIQDVTIVQGVMLIEELIAAANQRLKSQGIKLKICKRGEKLYLRGKLPAKDGEGSDRQHLALGFDATLLGVQMAESKAIEITVGVNLGTFTWDGYLKQQPSSLHTRKSAGEWISQFEDYYFNRRFKNNASLLTWKKDYLAVFRKLNWDKPLTAKAIESAILSTPPDTRVRQRSCMVFTALAKFAKIEANFSQWAGTYSPKKVQPRNIPSDELISQTIKSIQNPAWRWVTGILATYGLRNHEVFRIDTQLLSRGAFILQINSGKTDFRRVYPIYFEWFEEFDLQNIVTPQVDFERPNHALGHTVSQAFRRLKLPFRPYDLRHAWAIRALLFGLDVSLAAQMMGHSLKIHTETYQHWINERHYEQAFKLLMNRSDRPLPPV